VPLNTIALSTLPRHIMTQGTAIRSLMRNLGGSVGISILVAILAQNTQAVHAQLVEALRPYNPIVHAPYLAPPFSLSTPSGIAALDGEVTRQAAMVANVDDFKNDHVVGARRPALAAADARPARPASTGRDCRRIRTGRRLELWPSNLPGRQLDLTR
jgi:DHA2 family multidrug resistance protein